MFLKNMQHLFFIYMHRERYIILNIRTSTLKRKCTTTRGYARVYNTATSLRCSQSRSLTTAFHPLLRGQPHSKSALHDVSLVRFFLLAMPVSTASCSFAFPRRSVSESLPSCLSAFAAARRSMFLCSSFPISLSRL